MDRAKFADFEHTRSLLVAAGHSAHDEFTREPIGEVDARAMAEERAAFCQYVDGLRPPDLHSVEPLPNRRVLTVEESKSIWSPVRARWQFTNDYWYPLAVCTLTDVIAFNANAFEGAVPYDQLRTILIKHGVQRVWELREYRPEYEQDVLLLIPRYNGAEGYWSSAELDWIIYASHEASVTIGGWLVGEIEAVWPAWKAHVWSADLD
jgi:hypothetical protein